MQRWRFGIAAIILLIGALLGFWAWEKWLEHSQDEPIRIAAKRYGIEPALVKAVVWRESHFHPRARGRAGEIGLMQLREVPAQEWADAERLPAFDHAHCFDPGTNTLAGSWYLRKLLKRYAHTDNPLPYALADYNAGRSNVLKWITGEAMTNSHVFVRQIRFPRTKDYLKAVMRRYELYRPVFQADIDS